MKRPKKRVRKFTHEQLSRILSMAALGLIVTEGGNWSASRQDMQCGCPLQAAHNVPNAAAAAQIDPNFAQKFDDEATIYLIVHAWYPDPEEMLAFIEDEKRA